MAQRGSGTGGGFFCAFETDGQVRFREHTDEEAPLDFAVLPAERQEIDPSQPTTEEEILLEVDILPRDDGQFDVQLTARDADGTLRTRAMRHGVDENELLGGISLVSSPPPGESGARWWFRDLRTGGEKFPTIPIALSDRSSVPSFRSTTTLSNCRRSSYRSATQIHRRCGSIIGQREVSRRGVVRLQRSRRDTRHYSASTTGTRAVRGTTA
ncbi:hypothetical protein ACFQJ8_13435 [Halocatena marina]|uniref:hypothetical protein n=1 Tax=Halocatena marina TaxID=2934937 RepID=UPI003622EBC0